MKYDKESVLKCCRYYHGEEECPEHLRGRAASFWFNEFLAVVDIAAQGDVDSYLEGYKAIGEPGKSTGINPIILATMFYRYCKGDDFSPEEHIEPFENIYLKDYIASTSR